MSETIANNETNSKVIDRFFCQQCSLRHEQVRREKSGFPVHQELTDYGYNRIGLCDSRYRENNLSCAHTGSRKNLIKILQLLPTEGQEKVRLDKLAKEIHRIEWDIIQIDIKKSGAEIEHARLTECLLQEQSDNKNHIKAELAETEASIASIITEYHELVNDMQNCLDEARQFAPV